jgi:hypothetical protein
MPFLGITVQAFAVDPHPFADISAKLFLCDFAAIQRPVPTIVP